MLVLRGTPEELRDTRADKVLTAARYASVSISRDEMTVEDMKALTPFAKSLVMSFRNQHVTTSNAMMRTVASLAPASGLLGSSDAEDAMVDGWLSFVWTSCDVPLHALEQSQGEPALAIQNGLASTFRILDAHLKDQIYMVGDGITLADISLAVTLRNAKDRDSFVKSYSNISRWYQRMHDDGILQSSTQR